MVLNGEAVTQRCFIKKMVLQISENSQEKICNKLLLKLGPGPWTRALKNLNPQNFGSEKTCNKYRIKIYV